MPLDIAIGIGAAFLTAMAFSLPLAGWLFVVGVGFALLPDIDFLLYLGKRSADEFSHEHRDLLHNPLLYLPIGTVLLAVIHPPLGFLFLLASVGHFIHDSIGGGWGVRWLYPFSKNYFKFFSDERGAYSRNLIAVWTPHQQKQAARAYGDPQWLTHYLNFSPTLIFEISVLIILIALAFVLI